ncbi:putative UDP-glucuronosyltransferase ugt-56 isoform X3 [Symsagittifera roscoffensis]|uniref:putative UDP-glucuronosyltransferase ugt-56 isoform X3 n=1 Tax=Symsagittifera roscoffensis TaxID=84072 RepID=UPI00307BFE2D
MIKGEEAHQAFILCLVLSLAPLLTATKGSAPPRSVSGEQRSSSNLNQSCREPLKYIQPAPTHYNSGPKELKILYTVSCHKGHINPNAAIARELVSRGHQVDLLTTGLCGETAAQLIPGAHDIIALDIHPQKCLDPGDFLDMIASARDLYIERHTKQAYNATLEQLRRRSYDILVGNFVVPGGIIAAKVSGVPVVTSTVGPVFLLYKEEANNWDFEVQINLPDNIPHYVSLVLRALLSTSQYFLFSPIFHFIQEQYDLHGLSIPETENDGSLPFSYYYRHTIVINQGLPQLNLRNISKLDEPDNIFYTGFRPDKHLYPKIEEEALLEFIRKDNKTIIFVSLGTVFDIGEKRQLDFLAEIESQNEFKFVWAVLDKYTEKLRQAQKNDKTLFIGSYLPQGSILMEDNVKVFLTHCGANSVQDAIYAGKPMLTFPGFGDQVVLSKRIVALKMGIRLKELTQTQMKISLDQILEPRRYLEMGRNLEQNKDLMMSLGGSQKSADVIEQTENGTIRVNSNVSLKLGSYYYVAQAAAAFLCFIILSFSVIVTWSCTKIFKKVKRKIKFD